MTVLHILVQTDPLSAQLYIITGYKLYFTISFVVMREHWIHIVHLFVKAVELHHRIPVAILLILKLFFYVS